MQYSLEENLKIKDVSDILKLALWAKETLGMVMILTSLSALQEKLNEIVDQIKTRRKKKDKICNGKTGVTKQLFRGVLLQLTIA